MPAHPLHHRTAHPMTAKTDKIGKYMMNNNYFASSAKDETPIGLAHKAEGS